MTKPTKSARSPVLASIVLTKDGDEEFWWNGEPGKRGAVVFKTDRFGQRWVLALDSTHWATQRVAAGLLEVTVMTINNWIRDGRIAETKKRKGISVIPLKEIEKIAEERGIFIHKPLTPDQRRAMRAASFKWRKGGETDANQG